MDTLTLETTYIPHIRNQLGAGSSILFLGAGFSLSAVNRAGAPIPSAPALTKVLWTLCFGNEPFDDSTQLQDIFEAALNQKPKELTDILQRSFTVDPDRCPEWYGSLLTMPWLRIYTLNIDDLVTKVLSIQTTSRPIRAVSATTTTAPIFDDSKLSVIHLNGSLEDVPKNVTFSRSQYAQRKGVDPAYAQLNTDLLFRSLIFIGSSMEDAPFWEHIEMRGPRTERHQRELRPRSYLVVPTLNRSKQALLSRYNVVWLPMNGEQFYKSILEPMIAERTSGNLLLKKLSSMHGTAERLARVADLAAKSQVGSEEYLLGAEPTWADVTASRVAKRDCFEELWVILNEIRAEATKKRAVILTGTAGTGKSSALMVAALRLEAEGLRVGWLDADSVMTRSDFRKALSDKSSPDAILINDADIYDARLSSMIRDAIEHNPRIIVVCETRSSKVDRVINKHELGDVSILEYTIPPLGNNDIDGILDVLDREHRLGLLKGMGRDERCDVFRKLAGRQLLVAMHIATHGREFEEKIKEELKDLKPTEQFIYGLVCVASSHRFSLRQEDIGIACSDEGTSWIQSLDALKRRKLILPHSADSFRARHRVIAQFAYDSFVELGQLHPIIRALIKIGATKTTQYSQRESTHVRLLRTFINHNQMKRGIDIEQARQIYSDFEDALAWSHHFWLHRGALELESNNLDRAENFLKQAKSIDAADVFVDNELAYLSFKKAIDRPSDQASSGMVDEAIATLNDIVLKRPDQTSHAYHIMGQQGLIWSKIGIADAGQRKQFLEYLLKKMRIALNFDSSEMMRELQNEIQRALLMTAVQ